MSLSHLIQADTNKHIAHYIKRFKSLDKAEQVCLLIMSVVHKPIGIARFEKLIRALIDFGFLTQTFKHYQLDSQQRQMLVKQSMLDITREGLHVNRLICTALTHELEHLEVLGEAKGMAKLDNILMALEHISGGLQSYHYQAIKEQEARFIRDFHFFAEYDMLERQLQLNPNTQLVNINRTQILVELLFLPFDLTHFVTLPHKVQYAAFASLLRLQMEDAKDDSSDVAYTLSLLKQVVEVHIKQGQGENSLCKQLLLEHYLYQAKLDEFEALYNPYDTSCYGLQLKATFHFLTGDIEKAYIHFEDALKAKKQISKKRNEYLGGTLGFIHKLCLLIYTKQLFIRNSDPDNPSKLAQGKTLDANKVKKHTLQQLKLEGKDPDVYDHFFTVSLALSPLASAFFDNPEDLKYHIEQQMSDEVDFFTHHLLSCIKLLRATWTDSTLDFEQLNEMRQLASDTQNAFLSIEHHCIAMFCEQILTSDFGQQSPLTTKLESSSKNTLVNITQLIEKREAWENALDKLLALAPQANSPANSSQKPSAQRLIWELHHRSFEDKLVAREQKQSKSAWSKGRVIALKRLYEEYEQLSYLSETDKKICQAIQETQAYYYGKNEYSLSGLSALQAACDIDNLYLANDLSRPIKLSKIEPELIVSEQDTFLCLSLSISPAFSKEDTHYRVIETGPREYQLCVFNKSHIQVAKVLGEEGLLVPIEAKQRALQGISAIAPLLNIQSDIAEIDTGLATVECDPNLVINIKPFETGLSFHCHIMPFGEEGAIFTPGIGNASLTAQINGKRVATHRDLVNEQQLLDALDKACPNFLATASNELLQADLQQALETLEQLQAAQTVNSFPLKLRWPSGKSINLSKALSPADMQLATAKRSEWFEMTGHLQINNDEVISLRELLKLISTSNGRFIELDEHRVLALTISLKEQLATLNHALEDDKFHPLAGLHVEQATTGMRMKTIHAWEKQRQLMQEANQIEPKLPSTLKASLRDYQKTGFDWAMRLAHWGAGACLADDMGLGKTLQAMAVILARAEQGPSLILAPTSVCFNWQQEISTFAPTLKVKLFNEATGTEARTDLLENLQAFDCLIVSYGLLQRESELLAQTQWQTLVADEAQALKNPLSKRTKAAYQLKADFKMITTGTPIENDLTELWSLFRIINPGLLGNLRAFTERFIHPINNEKEDRLAANQARQGLKTLIQPFMLRRLKSQVLKELPSRTEISLNISLDTKQQAFYEALRLNAVEAIEQAGLQSNKAEQRIKMLAELTKLRQACCHPKLVFEESELASAKLTALDELLNELLANNHKVLIFSQFVGHLQIIKSHIERKQISYQYLDGSTPQKDRKSRVNAFQNGQGDVFLISLKAGGFGLNLTAADYVIHMDPWWNPAVEDQASDRAHRIGQLRPVTIYRMITQNTIEEKIMALHKQKRDLADQVLAGNESAKSLSVDDMMLLLKEKF